MAKDIRWAELPEMHGKISKKYSKIVFRHNGDTCYSAYVGKRTKDFSADELARQAKFSAAAAAVKTVMSNPTQLATYTAAFTQQTKYKTLRGYIFAQKYAEAGE